MSSDLIATLEVQKRDEQLQKPLDSSNKGFEMLQKLGYKVGEGLGKNNSGRLEPVPFEIKVNRSGLGKENVIKRNTTVSPTQGDEDTPQTLNEEPTARAPKLYLGSAKNSPIVAEHQGRTRNTILQSAGKSFSETITATLTSVNTQEQSKLPNKNHQEPKHVQIGRASCRERV